MAKRSKPDRRQLDAGDVIAGRGRVPTARELIELIREVNPTGLSLPAREMARRYGQKSRLQSVLIRRFESDIEVNPDPHDEGVVSLRYRPLDADACHALLRELDDDARSWAQRQVDLKVHGEGPGGEADRRGPRAAVHRAVSDCAQPAAAVAVHETDLPLPELLHAGQEAMEAYDYERARECFLRAFDQAQGGVDVALPVLSLLVEHLAADEEALMLEARLAPAALKQSGVRRLLALAAARLSQRDRAEHLLKEDRDPAAADAYVALARTALMAGDLDGAARDLARARELCPSHALLAGVANLLQERQAQERRPLEQELARLVVERRLDEAETHGQRLLARWPDSAPARKALREIEELRKADRIKCLLRSAEEALGRGEALRARSLMQQVLATGLRGEEAARVQRQIAELDAAQRATAERAHEEHVLRLLAENDVTPGLLAYIALDGAQRSRVRAQLGFGAEGALAATRSPIVEPSLAPLDWLDQMGVTGSGARARAAAAAVLALARAARIVTEQPAAALDLVADHAKPLQGIQLCEDVVAQARQRLDALQREQHSRRLEAARAAFAAGAIEQARELLMALPMGPLAAHERALAGELRTRIDSAFETRSIERLRADGALLRAREAADKLVERLQGPERGCVERIQQELGEAIRQAFRVRLDRTPCPRLSLRDVVPRAIPNGVRALLPDSGELLIIETRGVWVFLRLLDVTSMATVLRVTLRTPRPLELRGMHMENGRLLLSGLFGSVLELSLSDWTVLRWHEHLGFETDPVAPKQGDAPELLYLELVQDVVLVPHTRWLWFSGYVKGRGFLRIADLSRGRVVREFHEPVDVRFEILPELDKPCVAVVRRGEVALYDPRGSLLEGSRRACTAFPNGIVVYPGQQKVLVFIGGPGTDLDDHEKAIPVRWCTLGLSGDASPEVAIVDLVSTGMLAAAVDPEIGMVFLRPVTAEGATELIGLRASGEGSPSLERMFRVPMPDHSTIIQGWKGQGVMALVVTEQGADVIRLGAEPPEFSPGPAAVDFRLVHLKLWRVPCHWPTGARKDAILALSAAIANDPGSAWLERIEKAKQENNPDRLIELSYALEFCHESAAGAALAVWILQHHPDHQEARLGRARALANAQAWGQVRSLLETVDPNGLDEDRAQHLYHMLGVALVQLGEQDKALRVLREAESRTGGECDLSMAIALCTPLPESPDDPDECTAKNADQALVRTLMRAIRAADACLERRDAAGAMRWMDQWEVIHAREVQSMARLAEAYLRGDEVREERRFDKAFVLAAFCALHAEQKLLHRRELPLVWDRWPISRLDEVSARATQWLDRHLGEAWPVPPGGF